MEKFNVFFSVRVNEKGELVAGKAYAISPSHPFYEKITKNSVTFKEWKNREKEKRRGPH